MKNFWQIMGHVSEFQHEGDYVCLPWKADGELAIMRNVGGTLTAFDNRCPHRGARIFTTMRGNRPPICGYHGRCAKPEEVNAFALLVDELGWIFVGDAPAEAPVSPIEHWTPDFYRVAGTSAPLQYHGTVGPYSMQCDWAVAVENALDREHIGTIHETTLGPLGLRSRQVIEFRGGSSLEVFEAADREKLDRLCELFVEPSPVDYFHMHFFPHTALSSTRGTSYSLQHYFPRADGTTHFVSRLYGTPAINSHACETFLESVVKFNTKVFAEDSAICALVPAGHTGRLQPNEARIAHFREYAR